VRDPRCSRWCTQYGDFPGETRKGLSIGLDQDEQATTIQGAVSWCTYAAVAVMLRVGGGAQLLFFGGLVSLESSSGSVEHFNFERRAGLQICVLAIRK
jgi:hypothetical protein